MVPITYLYRTMIILAQKGMVEVLDRYAVCSRYETGMCKVWRSFTTGYYLGTHQVRNRCLHDKGTMQVRERYVLGM